MMLHDAMHDSVTLRSGDVARRAVTFGHACARMFGWVHAPAAGARTDVGVLVCSPWGADEVNGHRILRETADRVAAVGVTVLRFDYPGCGDSMQDELDGERLSIWESSVCTAADALRVHGGCRRVVLVGVRLGAALAAMAWRAVNADALVLWHPVVRGAAYIREVDATARFAAQQAAPAPDLLEYAGHAMNAETIAALRRVDLQAMDFAGLGCACIIHTPSANVVKLAGRMRDAGVALDLVEADDLDQMICEARDTVVPGDTIGVISAWVGKLAGSGASSHPVAEACPPWPAPVMRVDDAVAERALTIAVNGRQVFAIASVPVAGGGHGQPPIVFLNSGADDHIGPGRLYVKLARALARVGYASVRIDLAGLGDSAVAGVEDENAPFPGSALDDVAAVFAAVRTHFDAPALRVVGLCSGATHAFLAGACAQDSVLRQVILLNPMAFLSRGKAVPLVDGDFLRLTHLRRDAAFVGGWWALIRARRNWVRLPYAALVHGLVVLRRAIGAFAWVLGLRGPGHAVARGLAHLRRRGTQLVVLVSPQDPGFEMLRAQAQLAVAKGLRDGSIVHQVIADADHIFGTSRAQQNLIKALRSLLAGGPGSP